MHAWNTSTHPLSVCAQSLSLLNLVSHVFTVRNLCFVVGVGHNELTEGNNFVPMVCERALRSRPSAKKTVQKNSAPSLSPNTPHQTPKSNTPCPITASLALTVWS